MAEKVKWPLTCLIMPIGVIVIKDKLYPCLWVFFRNNNMLILANESMWTETLNPAFTKCKSNCPWMKILPLFWYILNEMQNLRQNLRLHALIAEIFVNFKIFTTQSIMVDMWIFLVYTCITCKHKFNQKKSTGR